MKRAYLLSLVFGGASILVGLGDFAGHLWDRASPHPAWAPLVLIGIGVLLMFPERIEQAAKAVGPHLPWGQK